MPQDNLFDTLPSWTEAAAAAASSLACALPARFDLGDTPMVATWVQRGWATPPGWLRAGARLGDVRVTAAATPALLPQAAARWPELQGLQPPAALHPVLLGVLLSDLSGVVERWCGLRPVWGVDEAGLGAHGIVFMRAGTASAAVWLDDAGLAWAAAHRPSAIHRADIEAVPLVFAAVLARLAVTCSTLVALRPGDVVLLDTMPVDPNGTMAVVFGPVSRGPRLRARLSGTTLELLQYLDGTIDMSDPADPAARPAGLPPVSIDDLPLVIEVEAGRLTLPLARLRELAPGQVLDLGFDATARVVLRVNDFAVAEGSLVRIADRTGVRLTTVHLPRDA